MTWRWFASRRKDTKATSREPKSVSNYVVDVQQDGDGWFVLAELNDGPQVFRLPTGYDPETDDGETVARLVLTMILEHDQGFKIEKMRKQ